MRGNIPFIVAGALLLVIAVLSPTSAQVTIGLEQAVYVTMEGQTQEVCASVTSGSISVGSTFRVGYGSLTGTASSSASDFNAANGILSFTSSSTRNCISIVTLADADDAEGTESFILLIFDQDNDPELSIGPISSASISITDGPATATQPPTSPTDPPTNPPTNAPTDPPTNAPTNPPTDAPTNPPTNPPPATTSAPSGGGDDPHFSIILPSGKLLCFTVQGEHGFSFSLISNPLLDINALFVPDSKREEVTWMGSIGIVVRKLVNGLVIGNQTTLRFDASNTGFSIGEKMNLDARSIKAVVFANGKMHMFERHEGSKRKDAHPSIDIQLMDAGLHFTVSYHQEHLDIYWNSVGVQDESSDGLIGQFFRKGVEIDEVRKILLLPDKPPIPVMRRPVWSFMERHVKDDQLCWTAMNYGYQGEGLITGSYLDYVVDGILSTDKKSMKRQN